MTMFWGKFNCMGARPLSLARPLVAASELGTRLPACSRCSRLSHEGSHVECRRNYFRWKPLSFTNFPSVHAKCLIVRHHSKHWASLQQDCVILQAQCRQECHHRAIYRQVYLRRRHFLRASLRRRCLLQALQVKFNVNDAVIQSLKNTLW